MIYIYYMHIYIYISKSSKPGKEIATISYLSVQIHSQVYIHPKMFSGELWICLYTLALSTQTHLLAFIL